jgi:DNA-binding NarL/FixJ family response regulator
MEISMVTLEERSGTALDECSPSRKGWPTRVITGAVLIIEDHEIVRHALQSSLRRLRPDLEQVYASSASAAIEILDRSWLRVVVDPDAHGVREASLLQEFSRLGLAARCCLITTGPRDKVTPYLHGLECVTCMSTRIPLHEFDAAVARSVLGIGATKDGYHGGSLPYFTPRQSDLLRLLQQGLSNKAIARELGITEGTVRNYLHSLMKRIGVHNRTQAAQAAARLGIT